MNRQARRLSASHQVLERGILVSVLVITGIGIAAHLAHVPIWISIFSLFALALRYAAVKFEFALPWRVLLMFGLFAGVGGVLLQYGTLLGRDAGIALLILMAALKAVETRHMRDAMVAIFLSYFVLSTQFFYTQNIAIALYSFVVSMAITSILIQLNQGNEKFTLSLRLKWAGRMLLQSLPLMILLFLLFPRLNGPLWRMPEDSNVGVSGLSDTMTPGSISQLIHSKRIAFRVSFDDPIPPMSQRYWRGPVLWNFDGKTWRPLARFQSERGKYSVTGNPVHYKVTLEPHQKRWVFALEMPAGQLSATHLTPDYQLLASTPIRDRREFQLTSYLNYSLDPELSAVMRAHALQLPPNEAGFKARRLATGWRKAGLQGNALIQQALSWFAAFPFRYTLTPPLLDGDPIDQFLFDTRQGFCEHYASSFVFLMRAAGLPARVVTGYLGGEWNPIGHYMLIRQADAHAWAEVWLKGRGWVRVDPTTVVSPDRVETGVSSVIGSDASVPLFIRASYGRSWFNQLNFVADNINYQWNRWVVAFGPEQQRALLRKLGVRQPGWDSLVVLLIIGCAALASIYSLLFIYKNRRSETNDPLLSVYRRFCEKMATVNLHRLAHEGPMDYAHRITRARPDLARQVMQISKLYCRLRYANDGRLGSLPMLKKLIGKLRL
jgi:transglutaminase-like putative cysteine protease